MKNKIGIGLVTYNAPERLKQSAFRIPENIGEFVIVNDGTPYDKNIYPKHATVITHSKNLSVGCAKNTALRYLMQKDCEHLFLIEDDILVKNPVIFERYIQAAYTTGLYHLMFGYHGPMNLNAEGKPSPRTIIEYTKDIKIALNMHCIGGFCYYHKGVITNLGYMEEVFKNAWEHVEHSYRIVKAGLLPSYWWWPDLADSMEYLEEIGSCDTQSIIRTSEEWKKNMQMGAEYFKHIHGHYPTQVPSKTSEEVVEALKNIKTTYGRVRE